MIARRSHRNQATPIPMATLAQGSPSGHALSTTKSTPPTAPMRAPTRAPFHCTEGRATVPFSGMRRAPPPPGTIGSWTCLPIPTRRPTGWPRRGRASRPPGSTPYPPPALVRRWSGGIGRTERLLVEWSSVRAGRPWRGPRHRRGIRAGRGVPRLARYPTTAFDISPSSVEQTRAAIPTHSRLRRGRPLRCLGGGSVVRPRRRKHERPGPARTATFRRDPRRERPGRTG